MSPPFNYGVYIMKIVGEFIYTFMVYLLAVNCVVMIAIGLKYFIDLLAVGWLVMLVFCMIALVGTGLHYAFTKQGISP